MCLLAREEEEKKWTQMGVVEENDKVLGTVSST